MIPETKRFGDAKKLVARLNIEAALPLEAQQNLDQHE